MSSFEPNYEGSPVVDAGATPGATPGAAGSHKVEARAGHHLTPQRLSTGGDVFEALGPGFTLLALDAEPGATKRFADAAAALRVPLAVVEDAAPEVREAYRARLVLVRPDQFVAWTGGDVPDPGAVLRHAVGHDAG